MADVTKAQRKSKEHEASDEIHVALDHSEHQIRRKLDLNLMPLFFVLCKEPKCRGLLASNLTL